MAHDLDELARQQLAALKAAGTHRELRTFAGAVTARMQLEGRPVVMFSSGNYLDLAHHPELIDATQRAARDFGCAAAGSRLINGNLTCHDALELELASFFGAPASLVFGNGYLLNVGVIPALVGEGDVIFSDALAHASIVDGARLSRAEVQVFPHNDVATLAERLRAQRASKRRALVIVDGVYSMDGDLAPLAELVRLAREHAALLLVDDSHGTGTLGAHGRGSAELCAALQGVDVLTGTLGKALGSYGAFVICSQPVRELLLNTTRSFVFSCALAPPQVEAARAALRLIVAEPWRRTVLQDNARYLRQRLAAIGVDSAPSATHIIPVPVGDNARTMQLTSELLARGFHAQGIRYPSVPRGTERLRLTVSTAHTRAELDALVDALQSALQSAA